MLLTYMCVPKHMCIEMKMITFCAFLCAFMRYDTNIENHDKYIQRLERIKSEVSKIYSRK